MFYKQLAELCKDVYGAPRGYRSWTPVKMPWNGLTEADFSSGAFFAQLYTNGNAYVLAFRGTVPTSIGD